MKDTINSRLFAAAFALVGFSVFAAEQKWPDYGPCQPQNRYTIEGANPVANMLYKGQYNTLHGGTKRDYDLVTVGDSITDNWSVRDSSGYFALSPKGQQGVFNLGIKGDRTEQLIWRLEEGGLLDNFTTKFFTLLIGTNNSFQRAEEGKPLDRPEEIAMGVKRIIADLTTRHPEAKIILMPILPYELKHNPRGPLCRANNEKVNDIIISFVDNKRVFWLDLRGGFLNADGSFRDEVWSADGAPGSDGLGHYLHPAGKGYTLVFDPAVRAAMKKYGAVPAGTVQETDPSLGYASVTLDGVKATATIEVSGVYRGTDAKGVPSKSYYVEYRLDGGKWSPALDWQGGVRCSFVVPNVAVGKHTCEIKVTTDAKKSVATTAEFTMCDAWSAEKLTGEAKCVRTDGELVYAYGQREYVANGVKFARLPGTETEDLDWGLIFGFTSQHPVPAGTEKGGYSDLIGTGWWVPAATGGKKIPLTLKKLTPGAKYLVQIFAYRSACNEGTISIDGTQSLIKAGGPDWPFGGVLQCTFTADAPTKQINIQIEGPSALNSLQLRKL